MIIRADRDKNFTVIKNTIFNDTNLSLKALGLAAFILTKPDGWNITSRGLESQRPEGRDAILGALKELETAGYIVRKQTHDKDGHIQTTSTMYESPHHAKQTLVGKSDPGESHRLVSTNKVNTKKDDKSSLSTTTDSLLSNSIKPKTGNPDVTRIIEEFETVFGLKLKRLTEQRRAAYNLIRRYGVEIVLGGISAGALARQEQYAPQITNLEDLWNKWDKLQLFYEKKIKQQSQRVAVIPED